MIIKKIIPTPEKLKSKRGMKRVGVFLEKYPAIFVMNRKTVALGFAIGVSMGVLPLPLQLLTSIILVILTGSNICAMFLGSLLSNPLTLPLIYLLAYRIGSVFLSTDTNNFKDFTFSLSSLFNQSGAHMSDFFLHVGKALLIGLPIEAFVLWIISFFSMNFLWKVMVIKEYKNRQKKRALVSVSNTNIISTDPIILASMNADSLDSLKKVKQESNNNDDQFTNIATEINVLEKELEQVVEPFTKVLNTKPEDQVSL